MTGSSAKDNQRNERARDNLKVAGFELSHTRRIETSTSYDAPAARI